MLDPLRPGAARPPPPPPPPPVAQSPGGHMLDRLVRGLPGHPLHPPLTDATIGMYTLAAALAVVSSAGWAEPEAAHGAWLALVGGLVVTVPTALTGFADWVALEWSSPAWRTA